MKTQFTPGPWHTGDSDWHQILSPKTRRYNDDGRLRLVNVATISQSDDEDEDFSNARLIKQSPDMFATLLSIQSMSESPVEFWSHTVLVNVLREIHRKATEAINHAK